jgi:hypothetical protein
MQPMQTCMQLFEILRLYGIAPSEDGLEGSLAICDWRSRQLDLRREGCPGRRRDSVFH